MRDLVHLQAGIVGMTDHDLSFTRAAGRSLIVPAELPVFHLAEPVAGFFRILTGRRRAAAGRLHIGLDHVKLAVAEFSHGMNIGIAVDPDARRYFRNPCVGPDSRIWRPSAPDFDR